MYSPLRHGLSIFHKTRPVHLTLFLTQRCNAHCPFCFYLQSSDHHQQSSHSELSLPELEKLSQSTSRILWLAFSGGEIFLRKDLVEISELFYKNNKPVFMLYPTNGLMPKRIKEYTELILQSCPKSTIAVKLSIDDLHESHDSLRNTPGSFDKTIKTGQLLGELAEKYDNLELGVNTVFCSQNQDSMRSIIDYVQGMEHITTHTISLVRGNLINEHYKCIDLDKYRQATDYLKNNTRNKCDNVYRFRGGRIKAAQDIIQRRMILETAQTQNRETPCYAGTTSLVVSENGEVYPCEIRSDSFGNIRDHEYSLEQVMQSQESKRIKKSISGFKCHCTHECNMMTNILFNPGFYPELFNEYRQIRTV